MIDILRGAQFLLLTAGLACASAAQAEVTRIEIASRTDVLAEKSFGDTGPYEKMVGKVFFAVDPAHPANKRIVDIDKAPRDASGRVLFSADLYGAMARRCSTWSTVAARTCSSRSTARRRAPTRPPKRTLVMAF